jgi:large subunit ribosomal protein L4
MKTKTINKHSIGFIHKIYLTFLKNKRKYLASTKTRGEVKGGGRKPWRQKGTGKARAGSIRSPLWVGGGVIFGPKPKKIFKKINKKENKLAIYSAFCLKKKNLHIFRNKLFNDNSILKTKLLIKLLSKNGFNKTDKNLLIFPKTNKLLWKALKNIKNLTITTVQTINIEQLLTAKQIILPFISIKLIYELYGKKRKKNNN